MKIIVTSIFLTVSIFAEYQSNISQITPEIKKRMIKGNSWRKGCPVPLKDLRYLRVRHIDFRGKAVLGEIIVHKDVAYEITEIFEALYEMV